MDNVNTKVVIEDAERLLEELEVLLEEQIALGRVGDIDSVGQLSVQSGLLVQRITKTGIFQKPQFEQRRGRFKTLYNDLLLVLANHRAEMGENLKKVRRVKKILDVYHGSV
jgi:hypothetical protein